jgi:hypothetical protein
MVRKIVIVVAIVALAYLGYRYYISREQTLKADNGDFTCQGCDSPDEHARPFKANSGTSHLPAMQTSAGDAPPTLTPSSPAAGSSAMVAPGDASNAYPAASQPAAPPAGLPAGDTESPDNPNGMRFTGSGNYQWYRQGNLTWRIDTVTGRSCIIYATMEEWRKQIVMSHGCGRSA